MKKLNRGTLMMTGLALLLAAAVGAWAHEKDNADRAFERFYSRFEPAAKVEPMTTEPGRSFKQRRVIVNDDGEVVLPDDGDWEPYMAARFKDTIGTQVDTYFLCTGSTDRAAGIVRSLQSSMAYWASEEQIPANYHRATRRYIDAAHKAGMEIFASIRMNDMHDAMAPQLTYPLKAQRPDLLIGDRQKHHNQGHDTFMSAYWVGLDYAKEDVRQHFLGFIDEHCRSYDYDGLRLDFCRGQVVFKLGEEDQNIETLTQFVRQVRQTLDVIGEERDRPYLLAVRALSTPDRSLRAGLDVEQWLAEDLLDLVMVGGGVIPYSPRLKQFIDMAHSYGVPAYPCINHFREALQMRTMASNFWALGGDGVYIFNYGGVPDGSERHQCLSQMGQPDTLMGLDKHYLPDNGFANWAYGHECSPPRFPVSVVHGTPIELVVGDDVEQAEHEGLLGQVLLQIKVSNLASFPELNEMILKNEVLSDERIAIQINGARIPDRDIERVDNKTFVASVTAPPLSRGVNHIVVLHGPNSVGALSATVDGLELSVDYKPVAPRPAPSASAPGADIVLSTVTPMPLSLYAVPVGTSKTLSFDLTAEPNTVTKARLALNAEDFDQPAELTIILNGDHPLSIPDSLLSDSGAAQGSIEIPPNLLRSGKNNVTFTFVSNLNGTTEGFSVFQAFLVLWLE